MSNVGVVIVHPEQTVVFVVLFIHVRALFLHLFQQRVKVSHRVIVLASPLQNSGYDATDERIVKHLSRHVAKQTHRHCHEILKNEALVVFFLYLLTPMANK